MSLEQKYKTGVLWQDIQHQQLVDLLEKFSDADEMGQAMFTYTLAFLVMYVNHHFTLEEAYMQAYGYSDLAAHKQEHADYIAQLKEFRQTHTRYSKEAGDILMKTVLTWILNHIMGSDQKLGKFILTEERRRQL
jgi:hemerythrin-like metal-binding protein